MGVVEKENLLHCRTPLQEFVLLATPDSSLGVGYLAGEGSTSNIRDDALERHLMEPCSARKLLIRSRNSGTEFPSSVEGLVRSLILGM